ncbi:MAG TPA: hypothetical protein VNQ90_04705 [Chthoniobacteraceae bacterium]|nr:hypothetical protein [Chthoniobacteraceae bacterium]
MIPRSFFKTLCTVALVPVFSLLPLQADEIEDTISEALTKYKAGELSGAGGSLQYALNLLNEQKSKKVMEFIPATIGDWKGDEGKADSHGMLGGGFSVSRKFTNEKQSANVKITMDSPLIQQMIGMLSNPMFAGQMGMKMRDIEGEKAMVNPKNGELSLVINSTILVQVKGRDLGEEELLTLAKGLDVAGLKAMK